jgi:SAM-dependent methyltransferase
MINDRWLTSEWPFVRTHLPPSSSRVVEIGCGPTGGFVPRLRSAGYDAVGVDPVAPEGPDYRQNTFEACQFDTPLDAIVACTCLHHVADLNDILDRVSGALAPGGIFVVVEWAHEKFDDLTSAWCFRHLADTGNPGWLHQHRDQYLASSQTWSAYQAAWANDEGLHCGRTSFTRYSSVSPHAC